MASSRLRVGALGGGIAKAATDLKIYPRFGEAYKYFRGRVWVRPLLSELYFVLTTPLAPIAHDFGIASRVELVEAGSATQVCARPKNAAPAQCAHPYLKSSPTPRKSTPLHRCQLSTNCNFLVTRNY